MSSDALEAELRRHGQANGWQSPAGSGQVWSSRKPDMRIESRSCAADFGSETIRTGIEVGILDDATVD